MKNNMHFGATAAVFRRARDFRSKLTPTEKLLWQCLRDHQVGSNSFFIILFFSLMS